MSQVWSIALHQHMFVFVGAACTNPVDGCAPDPRGMCTIVPIVGSSLIQAISSAITQVA